MPYLLLMISLLGFDSSSLSFRLTRPQCLSSTVPCLTYSDLQSLPIGTMVMTHSGAMSYAGPCEDECPSIYSYHKFRAKDPSTSDIIYTARQCRAFYVIPE